MGRTSEVETGEQRTVTASTPSVSDGDGTITGMTPEIEPLVARYLAWLRAIDRRPRTVDHRRLVLRSLTRWAGEPILYLTHERLTAWQVERSKAVDSSTLRGEMSAAIGFYRWATREQYLDTDPTVRLTMPRYRRGLPRPMADDRIRTALAAADPAMAAILCLAGMAGLRACEIAGLRWEDVDRTQMQLRVIHGKGGRERAIPLSPGLLDRLGAIPPPHRGPVIKRRDGQAGPNLPHTVSHISNLWLHEAGFAESLHQLRHRFGTQLLEASGGDLRTVQEAMGHASPATTAIYTKVNPARMRSAVDAVARLAG